MPGLGNVIETSWKCNKLFKNKSVMSEKRNMKKDKRKKENLILKFFIISGINEIMKNEDNS